VSSARVHRAFAASWLGRLALNNLLAGTLAVLAGLAGIATYLVLTEQSPLAAAPDTVATLIAADLTLLAMLMTLVGWRIVVLLRARAQGRAGAKLHLKLVLTFSLLAVLPAVIVSGLSAVFFFQGIQTWFSSSVSSAVGESRSVAQAALEAHQRTILAEALTLANSLNREVSWIGNDKDRLEQVLNNELRNRNLSDALIFDGSGKVLARSDLGFSLGFDTIRDVDLTRARAGDIVMMSDDGGNRARALYRLDRYLDAYLLVSRLTDPQIIGHLQRAEEASSTYSAYEQRREELQRGIMLIFVIVGLVLLLGAVLLGLNIANQIIKPISALIHASDRVRSGDLSVRVPMSDRSNELGMLIRSFNRMTNQLQTQRRELTDSNRMLDERRRFTEAVLAGVSAGVINMDDEGVIKLVNEHAAALLGLQGDDMLGRSILELLPEMEELFLNLREHGERQVEQQIIFKREGQTPKTLHARIAPELVEPDLASGYVLTFDDISALVAAQRMAAWGDVARRIAHEIKNPLTPIQLSAERLKRKYLPQITQDVEIFRDCTETIFRHVDDIRRMVDEFSAFARMPAAVIRPHNLSALVREAVVLQREAHRDIAFSTQLPETDITLPCDHRQMRQAITNLIQNAIDAITERADGESKPGAITIALTRGDESITVEVSDNGKGLPQDNRDRLTEPYVTTRAKGTGLGLAIVKKILEDHEGRLELADRPGGGAIVRLVIPATHATTELVATLAAV
jgi:two-component system, NtrC family, nitrogen regulation sensor histidine kinase NtrY